MNNIILIGMPGAGKSTIGVILAKTLGYGFSDTDLIIQKEENELLQNIINTKGLETFLKIEEDVVSKIHYENTVVATGGSVVYSEKAMRHLKEIGKIVYLEVPLPIIEERLKNIKTRGIAMKMGQDIKTLYEERIPLYEKYRDIKVNAGKMLIEQTIEEIVKEISNN
ncbi:shikimate kinase [Natranaerovirga pectinivora]|uniref:Shikimate kinase n=1 Tax=Natranaerovirga pectinivora TaxID=682400 RepID=A0A4R3MF18_9FIRM|nr:shikimate kinase [Natranaerovirga pectinivora]TCT12277.1 shikimate kinase [Natranaerovirga pectinivora]